MKYITLTLILMFATPLSAMVTPEQEQQIKETPIMTDVCVKKINQYTALVNKYSDRYKRDHKLLDKIKRSHFRAERKNWVDYCSVEDED